MFKLILEIFHHGFIVIIIFSMSIASCAGKSILSNVSYNTPHSAQSLEFSRFQSFDRDSDKEFKISDKEFKIKNFDNEKDSFSDKTGYIILGLALVGITAGAIVVPYMLLAD